jgi:hypothetical protein
VHQAGPAAPLEPLARTAPTAASGRFIRASLDAGSNLAAMAARRT